MAFIDKTLIKSGHRLFTAYRLLEEAQRNYDPVNPEYQKIKNLRRMPDVYREEQIDETILSQAPPEAIEIYRELKVVRNISKTSAAHRQAELDAQLAEEENERRAQAEGTMSECGCCFGDFPLNRMIHCDSESILHWFCRGCAKQMAENEIGNSKYELNCMSTDGCTGGFSLEQR